MHSLSLLSPAKINLFLQITGKKTNGFHELATAMQAISLFDRLHFEKTDTKTDRLTCDNPTVPTDGRNLVLKAAALFRKKTGSTLVIKCHLEKRIPSEAGLGGGSSNAASTLWAMNQLAGKPATNHQLLEWSAEIGSDIPFFFSTGAAYCTGRGEKVNHFDQPLLRDGVAIVKPDYGISTAACFKELRREEWSQQNPKQALHALQTGFPVFYNDLQAPAFRLEPRLSALKKELENKGGLMSGSGSAFWYCVKKEKECYKSVMRARSEWWNKI